MAAIGNATDALKHYFDYEWGDKHHMWEEQALNTLDRPVDHDYEKSRG